ncbi:MAG: aconitase X [Anaerolineales bacterium]
MPLHLSSEERAMLNGGQGPGTRLAMSILTRMAEAAGAERLIEISAAHIDSALYMGAGTLEFAERLAELGAHVAVPATLNVSGLDEHHWQQWPVPTDYAASAARQMAAYRAMGCIPTWTCTPYFTEKRPVFGQQIAWGESNAILFANSVIGARTERYPDLLDICAAITGRAPALGLHLEENRAGQLLFSLVELPPAVQADELFYPVLGALVGKIAGSRVPVITGLQRYPDEDRLKALCAAMASAGGVGLFHLVGVTPEAPTQEAAFQGKTPQEIYHVDLAWFQSVREELTTARGQTLDLVAIGCPHFSLDEFEQLAGLVASRQRHPNTRFLIAANRATVRRADENGLLAPIESFGAEIVVDTCILTMPLMLGTEVKTIMTNSGKYAYYTPGLLERTVYFADLAACVDSAAAGSASKGDPWLR